MRFFPQETGNVDAYLRAELVRRRGRKTSASPSRRLRSQAMPTRYNHRDGNDDYRQVTALFNLFDAGQKARLFLNVAEAMWGVPDEIAERQLAHFKKVHPDYEAGVRRALDHMTRAKASETAQQQKMPQGRRGRRVTEAGRLSLRPSPLLSPPPLWGRDREGDSTQRPVTHPPRIGVADPAPPQGGSGSKLGLSGTTFKLIR